MQRLSSTTTSQRTFWPTRQPEESPTVLPTRILYDRDAQNFNIIAERSMNWWLKFFRFWLENYSL